MVTAEEVQKMKVTELKVECTNLGLATTGLKADLISRLLDHINNAEAGAEVAESTTPSSPSAAEGTEEDNDEREDVVEGQTVIDTAPEPPSATYEESTPVITEGKRKEPEGMPSSKPQSLPIQGQPSPEIKKSRVEDSHAVSPAPNLTTSKKVKGGEVYVGGGLEPYTTEEDMRQIFGHVGEITEIRLKVNNRNGTRGYAFVRFSTKDAAQRAITELNQQVQCHGRLINVSATNLDDRLNISNIPPHWNEAQIKEALEAQDCDQIYEIELPKDTSGQLNLGRCTVEFDNRPAAQKAHRLANTSGVTMEGKLVHATWPAGSGGEMSASSLPDALQVKNIYVRGVPLDVTEQEIVQIFAPFGEIDNVRLSAGRNYAFVNYKERDTALRALETLRVVPRPEIRGQVLSVEMAKPPSRRPSGGAGPGAAHHHLYQQQAQQHGALQYYQQQSHTAYANAWQQQQQQQHGAYQQQQRYYPQQPNRYY